MDYGNKNKVYMFRLAILRSQSFGWQFCEAHCLEWQIANFLEFHNARHVNREERYIIKQNIPFAPM